MHRRCVYERSDENSNGCLSRSFANIKELSATFVPMCHVGNTAMWTRSGNGAIAGSKSRVFLFSQSQFAHFQRRIVERAWAKARQHVIFLQHRIFALLPGLQLNFIR